jgi:hypothetical protein
MGPTQHPIQWPLGVKQPEPEAYQSPQSSAEVKNIGTVPALPQYIFMAWCLVKQWTHLHGVVLS